MHPIAAIAAMGGLLLMLWWLYFIEYKRYRLDRTREDLYRLRDRLFEQFATSTTGFESMAYKRVRIILNGSIRYAHELSLSYVACLLVLGRKHSRMQSNFNGELWQAIEALPPQERTYLMQAIAQMHIVIFKHLIFNSLIASMLFALFVAIFQWTRLWHRMRAIVFGEASKKHWSIVDAEAERVGKRRFA